MENKNQTYTTGGNAKLIEQRFEIQNTLGSGGYGEVYLVKDQKYDGKVVALKVLNTFNELEDDILGRLKREIKVLGKLDHPNIVKGIEETTYKGSYAYTMEYFSGAPLSSLVEPGESTILSPEIIIKIMTQLLDALQAVHSTGVLHRDLKLENILVNERFFLKLIDFGLMLDEKDKRLTEQGKVVGTFIYMAPERALDGKEYDIRSEIYSCGLVLYELLQGKRRIPVYSQEEMNQFMRRFDFTHPALNVKPEYANLNRICQIALKKDPNQRFQSAREMKRAVEGKIDLNSWKPVVLNPVLKPEKTSGSRLTKSQAYKLVLVAALAFICSVVVMLLVLSK